MSDETKCGAPPNADTHLPPCELPAGHEGYHRAIGYAWGTHPTFGPLLPMPAIWAPDSPPPAAGTGTPDEAHLAHLREWQEAHHAVLLRAEQAETERDAEAGRADRLASELASTEAERDEARALASRRWEERRAALDVKTTEGLSASEWMLRTGKAEAEVRRLRDGLRGLLDVWPEDPEAVLTRAETTALAAARALLGENGAPGARDGEGRP